MTLSMSRRWQILIFLVIIATASFFRFYHINSTPPGLYPDEAMNGNDAQQAWETKHFQIFYPNNNGREGLYNNLTAVVFGFFGVSVFNLKIISILSGILGVVAVYLLAKEMFSWQIAAFSAWLMAISFWAVNFSRISFRAGLAPTIMCFGVYFLWRGLKGKHFANFLLSGLIFGLGFYTYIAYRVAPAIILLTLLAYQQFIRHDYTKEEYQHARQHLLRGLALVMIVGIAVALPLGLYFLGHPGDFFGRTTQVSIFAGGGNWAKTLFINFGKTIGMFNFEGDGNWRHNFAGRPELLWPISLMFAAGFFRSIIKLLRHRKDHGHYSVAHTLLLSWFFIGLAPVFVSNEGIPHALRALMVMPPVFIMAGEGGWWFFSWLKQQYLARHWSRPWSNTVLGLVLVLFMLSLGIAEYQKYFIQWANQPVVYDSFNGHYTEIANEINRLPQSVKKYVIVEADGVRVNGIPMPAQPVMFITNTFTSAKQQTKNVFYLLPGQPEASEAMRLARTNPDQYRLFVLN